MQNAQQRAAMLQERQRQQQKAAHEMAAQDSVAQSAVNKAGSSILDKRKIAELVEQVSPGDTVAPEVEEVLLEIAEDFVDNVTNFACLLAKHRNSPVIEVQDLKLHLEKNWGIKVPGFHVTPEEQARSKALRSSAGTTAPGAASAAAGAGAGAGAAGGSAPAKPAAP